MTGTRSEGEGHVELVIIVGCGLWHRCGTSGGGA
jgi:hypothetical protein